ncbi:MAG: lipopolysaccharide biosynthesis protein [Gammaproteobacteria bacterium]|nr:lipopolysaccharide biosynthesis protein [Gammaproteobacteria bacterium]
MEENRFEMNLMAAVKRRLPIAVGIMLMLLTATGGLAFGLPAIYKSRAVILIEQKEVPEDLVRSLVTSFADQRIQTISQRVLTNTNLSAIVERFGLYQDLRANQPMELVLQAMRDDISVTPISADVVDPRSGKASSATIAFELSYQNKSADLSQRVANELVSLFLNENLKERTKTATETVGFLTTESERLRKVVIDLEGKLATFKEKNVNQLPELQTVNLELMNATQREISDVNSRIENARQQQIYLEGQLALQKPGTILTSDTGERILSSRDRLRVLQSQFVSLSSKYGANHPDVVAMKKEIDSLRSETSKGQGKSALAMKLDGLEADLAAAKQKYAETHPDIKRLTREIAAVKAQIAAGGDSGAGGTPIAVADDVPDNPAYIELSARLRSAQGDVHALEQQRADLKTRLADFQARFAATPLVEKEYKGLMRDYETAQQKYHEVQAKKQEAELATNLESEQKGERFEMVEPPVTPEQPAKPNRLLIGLLGVVLSFGGGIGVGAVAETLDTRVYGRTGILRLVGVAPLAVIPTIETEMSIRERRRRRLYVAGLLLLMIAAGLLAIHLLVSPLDVLLFRVLRVAGFST